MGLDAALMSCRDPSIGQRDDQVDGRERLMGVCPGALHNVHLMHIATDGGALWLSPVGDNRRAQPDRGGKESGQRGRLSVRDGLYRGAAQSAVASLLHDHCDHHLAQSTASPDFTSGATRESLIDFHRAGQIHFAARSHLLAYPKQ